MVIHWKNFSFFSDRFTHNINKQLLLPDFFLNIFFDQTCLDTFDTHKYPKKALNKWIGQNITEVIPLYKTAESGNGTKISDKNWSSVKSKYLENKKQ